MSDILHIDARNSIAAHRLSDGRVAVVTVNVLSAGLAEQWGRDMTLMGSYAHLDQIDVEATIREYPELVR